MTTMIICCSHLYVPTAISYILKNKENIVIYTDKMTLSTLFNSMGFDNVNVLYIHNPFEKTTDFIRYYISFRRYKASLLNKAKTFNVNRIVFFHDGYCEEANWLIMKLSKSTEVLFCPVSTSIDKIDQKQKRPIKVVIHDYIMSLLWEYPIRSLSVNSLSWLPFMRESFYRKVKSERITIVVDKEIIQKRASVLFPEIKAYANRIVLLQNDSVNSCISEEIYRRIINNIINRIGVNKLVFKSHPDHEKTYGKESDCDKLPNFISADLIIKEFKGYIGYASTVLTVAANEDIPAFSLLKLIPATNVKQRDALIVYLQNLSKKIEFPENEDDLFERMRNLGFIS